MQTHSLECIEISRNEIKYADLDRNRLRFDDLTYPSYYSRKISASVFDSICQVYQQYIHPCTDSSLKYQKRFINLHKKRVGFTIFRKKKKEQVSLLLIGQLCNSWIDSLFLVDEHKFQLVKKPYYFEGSKEYFDIPSKLPH